jgi:hypothetical protein
MVTQKLGNMNELNAAVKLKNAVSWDATPSGIIINRRFGGMCCLHHQSRRNNVSEEKC